MPEAQGRGAKQVAGYVICRLRRAARSEPAHQLVEGFCRAPVFLLLVGRQFHRHDRHVEAKRLGQAAGVVLDELGRAGCANQQCLGLETLGGGNRSLLEQLCRVRPKVARLEGGVGDRRPLAIALDHREQQVGIGVALWRMQHVVQAFHGGCDAHRADVRRAFICPHCKLHPA
jgi:hypothetical protein